MTFAGIPTAAFDFYDDLEADNSKAFWESHKDTYRTAVAEPMAALAETLAGEFGPPKLFRPHRDVRFAKDKSPYKTHQGLFVASGPATGWYAEVSAAGFRVGGGFYEASAARLGAIREAIAGPDGVSLEKLLGKLTKAGWELGGDQVKTQPRGFEADHPRIGLLRHKSIFVGRRYGFEPDVSTPALADRVRKDWRAVRPFVEWLDAHTQGLH